MSTQPTADQPLVTHADLEALRLMRDWAEGYDPAERILDRLVAAAEADKPALPKGWVLAQGQPRWHDGRGGISEYEGGEAWTNVTDWHSITPLVTAASLAPEGLHVKDDAIRGADGHPIDIADLLTLARDVIAAAQAERGESR